MSQGDVAKLLDWSLSKVQRIEGGEVGISSTDLLALLETYGITDSARVQRLAEYARISRRQRYMIAPEYREHLTPSLRELMQFEREAVTIRAYQPVSYPGVLQTPEVAEQILALWSPVNEEARRVRFDVRMSRRRQVIERPDGPEYFLILDQSVIKRQFGSAKATTEQLEYIADIAQRPNVHIRVLPLARGAEAAAMGAFQILSLDHIDSEDSLLYLESYNNDSFINDPDQIHEFRDAFERFWKISFNEEVTRRAVIAEAAQLRSSLDL